MIAANIKDIINKLGNIDFSDTFVYDSIDDKEYSYIEIFSRAYCIGSKILNSR